MRGKKMKIKMNIGQKIALTLTGIILLNIGYIKGLCYANDFINENSAKIKSESELVRMLNEKKKKYNFNKKIIATIDSSEETESAISIKNDDDSYEIKFNEDYFTERMLEHELYHVIDGHLENISSPLIEEIKYNYYQEPKTILHTFLEEETK
jgi:hypothetical protein